MDFGVVGLDEYVCSDDSAAAAATGFASSLVVASDTETKQKWYGSGFHKQERSAAEDDWRGLKVAKTNADDFSASKAITSTNTMLLHHRSPSLRSNVSLGSDGQQMLSFSSPNSQTVTLPYYHHTTSNPYATRIANAGYGCGGLNPASMHGVLTGARGPFTPSQWMELEHQALIYKYITANAPIPSNLLIPIKKALDSAGFSCLRTNTLGWVAFHLGFLNNTDPEPGRCRRTDGKKWRCSRDAVADQKYCERHMNRGRHRSRKPVEGQTGHSVSGSTTTTSKLMPMTSSASTSMVTGGDSSSSLGLSHHQLNNLQPGPPNSATNPLFNRSFLDKEKIGEGTQNVTGLSMLSPTIGLRESQIPLSNKQNPCEADALGVEFGLVSSDSLLNPMHRSSSLFGCPNNGSSEDLNGCQGQTESHQSLHQFMDDWPKSLSERSAHMWPDIDVQSDKTQLSISIPKASADFMSSTSSPSHEKLALSPLRLSREFESTQMALGVGTVLNEPTQSHANWIPISWETSMGGPLGEVLHSTNNSAGDSKNSSALNLMTEGWDSSPSMASSPTGVLQKAAFRSLSNSSAGSSPRPENNKTHERASLCHGLLGSNFTNPSLPAL